ncbi:MAG: LTA synthase family protein, partial [Fibrobacteraceae bacterium]|nr:LTA synthase family protein [Fibrobacteraceae bacterium]
ISFTAILVSSLFIFLPLSHGTKAHAIIRNRKNFNLDCTAFQKFSLYAVPFYTVYAELNLMSSGMRTFDSADYITKENIIAYVPAMFFASLFKEENIQLTEKDIADPYFQSVFNPQTPPTKASKNLIIIMMESFESWLIDNSPKFGNSMPNFSKFIQGDHILYASKVTSQAKYGVSGDGQMIVNSGLLPISEKAACIAYGNNKYPGLGEFYDNSALINPCPTNVWNQRQMTKNYGYKKQIQTDEEEDRSVFRALANYVDTAKTPFIAMGISIDTHLPFEKYSGTKVNLPQGTPNVISNFIKTYSHTDSTFGIFLEKFNSDSTLQNSTIVIVGDHTILKNDNLRDLQNFATENQLDFDGKNYVPLIIHDPEIQGNIHLDEVVYQMDIFPTLLHLLGQENYYFKGFGVNLLDSAARNSRYYPEKTAYEISEKII